MLAGPVPKLPPQDPYAPLGLMWNVWMLHPVYHRVWWILLVLHLLLLLKDLLGNSIAIPGFQRLHLQHHVFATSTLLQGSACIADQARTHPVLPCTQPLLEQLGNDLPVLVVKKLTLKHVLFQKHILYIYIMISNLYLYFILYVYWQDRLVNSK